MWRKGGALAMLRRLRLDRIAYLFFGAFISAVLFPYLREPFFVPFLDGVQTVARQHPYFVASTLISMIMCGAAVLWMAVR